MGLYEVHLSMSLLGFGMKRTRHQYHYKVRRAKRRKTEPIRTKLVENVT